MARSVSQGDAGVTGHEKGSQGLASVQALHPATERHYTVPPPAVTCDKV
jgi:hypothetical protein